MTAIDAKGQGTLAALASRGPVMPILLAISASHFMNDLLQSLVSAIYPILKGELNLSFTQIGNISLAFFLVASVLQPIVGIATDRRPRPFSLAFGMLLSLAGILCLAFATHYAAVLAAACLIGVGSSIFHPESSRVARMASGGRPGLAQSIFQVGGNLGSAMGPLMAALIVVPHGQTSVAWFAAVALGGMVVLFNVGRWYRGRVRAPSAVVSRASPLTRPRLVVAVSILVALIFSKYFYLQSLTTYYTFYLIDRFHLSIASAQIYLFVFMGAVAVGTVLGGPIGDRYGRKYVIWGSILGVLPFTLALPYANLPGTIALSLVIGLILASAFSAIVVYAQELMPGRVGLVSGLFFGFAFGLGGIGASVLGILADAFGIQTVYRLVSVLPALGILAVFLPDMGRSARQACARA